MSTDSEVIRFAGDVSIDKIEIISSNGFGQEVTNQVAALELYEDLFSPFTTGVLAFKDSLDLPNLFPFVGEEYVNIKIHTPSFTGKDKIIDQQFHIYKMSNRILNGDRNIIYELHFISREALVDLNKKVSKSYQGKCSDIARQIITDKIDGLETKKDVIVEETSNTVKFVANFWYPVKSLNYVAGTSANKNGASSYIFFENRNGLNFSSLETMYNLNYAQEFFYDQYMRDFTDDGRSTRNVEKEYQRIIEINMPVVYDYMDRARSGMYASRMSNYDITTKKYTVKVFDMIDDFPKQTHLNEFAPASDKVIRRPQAFSFDLTKYYGNFNGFGDVTNAKTIQRRISLLEQAKATKIEIVVPGRTDYTVGMKVKLNLNKFNPIVSEDTIKDTTDNMLSGLYVISAVNHFIDREKHQCHIEIIKDSFIVDLNKGGQ